MNADNLARQLHAQLGTDPIEGPAGHVEVIEDPVRIREVIGALVRYGCEGMVRFRDGGRAPISPISADIEGDEVRWRVLDVIVVTPLVIELKGYNSIFLLPILDARQRGRRLTTSLPDRIIRVRRRWLRRHETPKGALTAAVVHPESGAKMTCDLLDLSYGGLSLAAPQPFPEDAQISELVVTDKSGRSLRLEAVVRSVREDGADFRIGLKIQAVVDGGAAWVELVNDHLHPGTRIGSAYAEATWSLYEKCGYFDLSGRNPTDFAGLRRAFLSVSRQLDRAPHLACQTVWPQADGVMAALSILKVYHGTWLGFQMAKISGDSEDGVPGREILREIHQRTYEHVQRDPSLRWVVGYCQVKRVWSRLVHYDLPSRYVETGEAAIVRFQALTFETTGGATEAKTPVSEATNEELDRLGAVLEETRPEAYREALDLCRSRLDMAGNARMWRRSRLERERTILVARVNGEAVAAAVLESGAEGIHVYGLLDLVRLYALMPGGEEHFDALLVAAKAWFRARGKRTFVCFLEEGQALSDEILSETEDMGKADMVILSAKRLPELLEHCHEVTAPRRRLTLAPDAQQSCG